jgi:hypothetical protein
VTLLIVFLSIAVYAAMGTLCGKIVYAYGSYRCEPDKYGYRAQRWYDPEMSAALAGVFWPLALFVILAWAPTDWLIGIPARRAAKRASALAAEQDRNRELEALLAEARAEVEALGRIP